MKKMILAVTVVAVSAASMSVAARLGVAPAGPGAFPAGRDGQWTGTDFIRLNNSNNHFFMASHSPTKVCIGAGVGEAKVENVQGGMICGHTIFLTGTEVLNGIRIKTTKKEGVGFTVPMSREAFNFELHTASIKYVG